MSAHFTARAARQANRVLARTTATARRPLKFTQPATRINNHGLLTVAARSFTTSMHWRAGLMPDAEEPQPPTLAEENRVSQPTPLEDEEYHMRADEYMDGINEKAEEIQEGREDVEVEYSAGVLSINMPPAGTYVINKQPPNKQIWLSSPISGPKRYDWVVDGESMHEKEGSGQGDWVYLRDGSSLTELLRKELQITIDLHGHEQVMKQSVDPLE